jgi:hypothetical protein
MEVRCKEKNCTLNAFETSCAMCGLKFCNFHKGVHRCGTSTQSMTRSIPQTLKNQHCPYRPAEIKQIISLVTNEMNTLRTSLLKKIDTLSNTYLEIVSKLNKIQEGLRNENEMVHHLRNVIQDFEIRDHTDESIELRRYFIIKLKQMVGSEETSRNDTYLVDGIQKETLPKTNFNASFGNKKKINSTGTISSNKNKKESISDALNIKYNLNNYNGKFVSLKNGFEYFKVCKTSLVESIIVAIIETVNVRIHVLDDYQKIINSLQQITNLPLEAYLRVNYEHNETLIYEICKAACKYSKGDIMIFKNICGIYVIDSGNRQLFYPSENSKFDIFIEESEIGCMIFIPYKKLASTLRYIIKL